MADILRIKRRTTGAAGAPTSLANAELAYNEADHTLYYGEGTGGAGGTATSIVGIAGQGLASNALPRANGSASAGVATTWTRSDHVHPADVSWAPAPPAIGSTTPAAGAFTSLSATSTVSGAGFTSLLAPYALLTTHLNQFAVPTADISWNSFKITNLAAPISNGDAANKAYVDANSAGLSAKSAVAVATAGANITLSGLQTIDGYTTLANDRVLVKDQTTQANNGLYVAVSGAWTRATDMDAWLEVPQAYVFVVNGTVNASSAWTCNSAAGGTLGTTAIIWVQFSQTAQVTAGGGLTRTGNSFDVIGTANRIAVFADNVDIATTYVGQTSITTVGTVTTGTWSGLIDNVTIDGGTF